MKDRKQKILDLLGNDEDALPIIQSSIMNNSITAQAYADVMKYMYCDSRPAASRLTYAPAKQAWRCKNKVITDMAVLRAMANVCQVVREYVLYSWEECVFSAWLSNRELERAEASMDEMESMEKLQEILALAAKQMQTKADAEAKPKATKEVADDQPKINWDELAGEEEEA